MIKRTISLICSIFFVSLFTAQSIEWKGKVSATTIFSSEDANPFWFYINKNGQFGTATQFSGLGEFSGLYAISEDVSLEAGATFFYRDEVADEFQRRDLYLRFKNKWLKVTAGSNRPDIEAQGLSTTNKNFLFSGNE